MDGQELCVIKRRGGSAFVAQEKKELWSEMHRRVPRENALMACSGLGPRWPKT